MNWLTIVNSRGLFRLLLAIPAVVITLRFAFGTGGFGFLINASGEWAARLLIVTLAVTPLRMLFKGKRWPMWLFKRRRELGVASFLYGVGHLGGYVVHEASVARMVDDLANPHFPFGWLALICLAVPFVLSNERALRHFGTWWKSLQRLVYLAAVAALVHWLLASKDQLMAIVHFAPLVLLQSYRVWYNFSRPARQHPAE